MFLYEKRLNFREVPRCRLRTCECMCIYAFHGGLIFSVLLFSSRRKHQRSSDVLDAPMTVTNGVTGTNDRRLVDGGQSALCAAKDIM